MSISRRVTQALAALSELTDQPGVDLPQTVSQLSRIVGHAVDSFCGLTVNTGTGPGVLRFTVGPTGDVAPITSRARSSLRLGSALLSTGGPALEIVLFATRPGAFVDLAADIVWATEAPHAVELDRHLGPVGRTDTVKDLAAASAIDRAIGALIGRGTPAARARAAIEERAEREGITTAEAAQRILQHAVDSAHSGAQEQP